MQTLLFFDDTWLTAREGLSRHLGKPRLIPQSVFSDPEGIIGMGLVSVHRDEASGRYLMYYPVFFHCGEEGYVRHNKVQQSADGITWEDMDTRPFVDIPGRRSVSQMLDQKLANEVAAVYQDPEAGPDARYKAFALRYDHATQKLTNELWCAPDGLAWRKMDGVIWHKVGAEPGAHVLYNPVRKCHTLIVRPDWGERRVAVSETTDFAQYSAPLLTMQADALDDPLTEIYGMPTFWYEGYFVAFPWLFHVSYDEPHFKFWRGKMHAQLAYSLNGVAFQRSLREPLFDNGEPGDIGYGCILPNSMITMPDGSLRVYAFNRTIEHGPWRRQNVSTIAAYALRRDGFVYLESCHGPATLRTRAMYYEGGPIEINAAATFGITCALYAPQGAAPIEGFSHEDCAPFVGDDTAWTPSWKDRSVELLAGKVFYLELRIETGRVYAIRGNFRLMSNAAAKRFEKTGILPQRIGL